MDVLLRRKYIVFFWFYMRLGFGEFGARGSNEIFLGEKSRKFGDSVEDVLAFGQNVRLGLADASGRLKASGCCSASVTRKS